MKKNTLKRLMTVAVSTMMLLPMFSAKTNAQEITEKKYIALGDSIAVGLSAEQGKGYVDIMAGYLKGTDEIYITKNLAQNGLTTTGLLQALPSYGQDLINAQLITLSIGGNNFLQPMIGAVDAVLKTNGFADGIKTPDLALKLQANPQAIQIIKTTLNSPQFLAQIQLGLKSLNDDLPLIIGALKKASPDAKVIINNLYNPISNGKDPIFGDLSDEYETICQTVNKALADYKAVLGFEVLDSYTLFKNNLGAVNFTALNPDPHPTMLGHSLLGAAAMELVKASTPVELNVNPIFDKDEFIYVNTTPGLAVVAVNALTKQVISATLVDKNIEKDTNYIFGTGIMKITQLQAGTPVVIAAYNPEDVFDKLGNIILLPTTKPLAIKQCQVLKFVEPKFTIEGVEDGEAYTNAIVPKVLLENNTDTLYATLNDEEYNFTEIKKEGKYELVIKVSNENGFAIKTINFEIKKAEVTLPEEDKETPPVVQPDNNETTETLPNTGGMNSLFVLLTGIATAGAGGYISKKK